MPRRTEGDNRTEPMICKKDMGCRREVTVGRYLDPFDGFREKEAAFEIRRDEIICPVMPEELCRDLKPWFQE